MKTVQLTQGGGSIIPTFFFNRCKKISGFRPNDNHPLAQAQAVGIYEMEVEDSFTVLIEESYPAFGGSNVFRMEQTLIYQIEGRFFLHGTAREVTADEAAALKTQMSYLQGRGIVPLEYNRFLQAEANSSRSAGMDYWFDGTALTWRRKGWALSWRGERQALPSGSTPLQINGGLPICGQGWTEAEVQLFHQITEAPVIFEYRTTWGAKEEENDNA
jgi:hypothetical protein